MARATLPILQAAGVEVVYELGKHDTPGVSKSDYASILHNLASLIQQFPCVKAVELWNEPNNGKDAPVSVDDLGQYAELAAQIIKPHARIVGPATEGVGGLAYFSEFVNRYGHLCDAFSHHFYYWAVGTDASLHAYAQQYASNFKKLCGVKPLWSTEYGILGTPNTVSQEHAATFFHGYTAGLIAGGVERAYHWALDTNDEAIPSLLTPDRHQFSDVGKAWLEAMQKVNNSL